MLDIDNEILDSLDSKKLLPIDNDTFEVSTLIDKYNLHKDTSLVNSIEVQYDSIVEYITSMYLQDELLPEDIKSLVKHSYNFKLHLLNNIQTRMKSIINESSIMIFKETYIVLNLLSSGNKYKFLTENNMFSVESFQDLLKDYEDNVCELFIKNDKLNFELSFKYYLTLLELLNEICIINSLDIQRRKNISSILEQITNTITNLKSKVELPKDEVESLNEILGKQLLYFTNMVYIPINKDNKEVVIQKYIHMLKKIVDGFRLLNFKEKYYLTFLDKITTLILTLIFKLKTKLHISHMNLDESVDLNEIYNLYNKNIKIEQQIKAITLDEFRETLLNNYKHMYSSDLRLNLHSYTNIIDHFIEKKILTSIDMVLIHNIVLYSDSLSKDKLDLLLDVMLRKKKFKNDYYEFYKLKIIDRVLQKYISLRVNTFKNSKIEDIIKYIEQNNIVSHLMSMYAKIYLSLSLYYSYEKIEDSQEESKRFYFIYKRLDNNNFLDKEFHSINKQILFNHSTNYFKLFEFRTENSFSNKEHIEIGSSLLKKSMKRKNLELKNESFIYIEKLIKEIIDMNEQNDSWLNEKIEQLLSSKIFFGLVRAKLVNKDIQSIETEVGFDYHEVEIINSHVLVLSYSSYYKTVFERISEKNSEFISLSINNIFKSYMNSIPSYTDTTTNLPNINKLKGKLKKLNEKELTFFEIYLDSLVVFSESYNIKTSNEFFKAITAQINKEYETYRLFGPKVGIVFNKENDYKEVVEFLQNLKVEFDGGTHDIKLTVAVTFGKANTILDKSFYSLSSAKISNDKLYIYE